MHPWMAGRIVETMQREARVRAAARGPAPPRPARVGFRARLGLALARLGYRIAGEPTRPAPREPRLSAAAAGSGRR
jgi:hypothetical protein